MNNSKIQKATNNSGFNECLIDFIVESENNQDTSNERRHSGNISNESEFKTNQNVDNNNEKTINTVEKQLLDLTSPRIFRQNFNR